MTWSRSTKLLLLAGCLAAVLSVSGVMTGFSEGVISMLADFYPGPCTGAAPSNITITYLGTRSGCSSNNSIPCQAGEEIRFEASSPTYAFQVCDRFIWTVGGDRQRETFPPVLLERFSSPGPRTVQLTVLNPAGPSQSNTITIGAPTPVGCGAGTDIRNLCLLGNRFRVTLNAEDPRTGNLGQGQAIPEAGTDIFGYFSIPALTNDPTNFEVFVKIVDATSIGAGYWIFYGGLTDLEYSLTVFDTVTGLSETYFKEGRTSQSGFDTAAFQGPHVPPPPAGSCPGTPQVTASQGAGGTCVQGGNSLCLLNGRFRVALSARDVGRTNNVGPGQANKKNEQFGWFSLPTLTNNPNNPEVFVKMLDARAIGSGFWIFYSGLTDMEFTLTVTDMTNGRVRTYVRPNVPAGTTPCGAFDTSIPQ